MDRIFDDLIALQRAAQPRSSWRVVATTWALRFAINVMTGLTIGAWIALNRTL